MTRISRWFTLAAVTAGTLGLAATAAGATDWTVVPPPAATPNTNNSINGAFARTDTDTWAVGTTFGTNASGLGTALPLALHWNGSTWSTVSAPATPGTDPRDGLVAVGASSASDAWAVGFSVVNTARTSLYDDRVSLYEHWSGTAWSIVAGPNIGTLTGVADFGASNAWAVGSRGAVHWDGTAWSTGVPQPGVSVTALSADGPNDIWAVSGSEAIHYNGTAWSPTTLPNSPGLSGVVAVSPNDVWAVGTVSGGAAVSVDHFDGTSWQSVTPPPNSSGFLNVTGSAVAARSATDVWVLVSANNYDAATNQPVPVQLLAHWNGSSWTDSPSPLPNSTISSAASSPGHVWGFGTDNNNQPLILSHS